MIRRLWRSTFGLVALVSLGFALATIAIGVVAYEVTHEALELQLDHRVAMETAALLEEAHSDGVAAMTEAIRRRTEARSVASLDYLLIEAKGRRLAGSIRVAATPPLGYEEFLHFQRGGYSGIAQSLTTAVPGGTLIVAADRAGLKEIDRTLTMLFAGALIAMLTLGAGAAALIGWITRRRLARIDSTALAIIGGDFAQRVPRDGSNSEFDRLAGTLNRMLDRISSLMTNLRQVSSDVAHDLRTPLTRLYSRLDLALDETDAEKRSQRIQAARDQASELLEIFAALLRIAEVEGMTERSRHQPVDLSALMDQMIETYLPDMDSAGNTLLHRIDPGISLRGDRRLLSQAIANLLDNCLRHTPSGTAITVVLEARDGHAHIRITDNGPGVPQESQARLFERFARAEEARSTPGHGLGLALVAAIAAAHGGRASLAEARGFGVAVALPL